MRVRALLIWPPLTTFSACFLKCICSFIVTSADIIVIRIISQAHGITGAGFTDPAHLSCIAYVEVIAPGGPDAVTKLCALFLATFIGHHNVRGETGFACVLEVVLLRGQVLAGLAALHFTLLAGLGVVGVLPVAVPTGETGARVSSNTKVTTFEARVAGLGEEEEWEGEKEE